MNILVSNDDGIKAQGLRTLVRTLAGLPGTDVYVCAPDGQRSACGHGITMTQPIMIHEESVEGAVWAESLSGTPADCVKSGIKRLKKEHDIDIDVVFSGINHGGNIGTDIFYSGTLAAAAEGVFCRIPSVAVSISTQAPTTEMFENCSTVIREVVKKAVPEIDNSTLLNINFPGVPPSEIRGMRVTTMGPREYAEKFDVLNGPGGKKYYWYTGDLVVYDGLPESLDVMANQENYVSITPLRLDVTDYNMIEKVKSWELKI